MILFMLQISNFIPFHKTDANVLAIKPLEILASLSLSVMHSDGIDSVHSSNVTFR